MGHAVCVGMSCAPKIASRLRKAQKGFQPVSKPSKCREFDSPPSHASFYRGSRAKYESGMSFGSEKGRSFLLRCLSGSTAISAGIELFLSFNAFGMPREVLS